MYCPQCGEETPDNSSFCRDCGTAIKGDISADSDTLYPKEPITNSEGGWSPLGKILAYAAGGVLILLGLVGLADSVVGAFVFLIGGVIALPIIQNRLANSRGIIIGQWLTVVIVIVAFLAGGMIFGASSPDGADPVGAENVETEGPQLIEKPATELVLQIDQLGAGWSIGQEEGNATQAVSRFTHTGEGIHVGTSVDRYDSVEEAVTDYEARVEEIQEQHGTDTVQVGDEGILYSVGDWAFVIFRDSNVVVRVEYGEDFGYDVEGEAVNYAELMYENFPR